MFFLYSTIPSVLFQSPYLPTATPPTPLLFLSAEALNYYEVLCYMYPVHCTNVVMCSSLIISSLQCLICVLYYISILPSLAFYPFSLCCGCPYVHIPIPSLCPEPLQSPFCSPNHLSIHSFCWPYMSVNCPICLPLCLCLFVHPQNGAVHSRPGV